MAWGPLATQFCLELAFGVLLGLSLLHRAPLGLFFHRLMAGTAALPLAAATLAPPSFDGEPWTGPTVLCGGAALAVLMVLAGPLPSARRRAVALAGCSAVGLALAFAVRGAPGVQGTGSWVLGSLSAMATGAVAGGVGVAMVVGHWYLTVPQLPVALLQRLNRWTAVAMVVSAVLVGASALVLASSGDGERGTIGSFGVVFLVARVAIGLALPLLFAWMAAVSLRYSNTRSATGILYASTVLVLIGAAVSLSLQDSYGIPL